MDGYRIEVDGARQLRRTLKAAGVGVEDLKAAHAAAAKYVEETSAAMAPVQTGRLLASLRSSGTQTAGVVRAGGARVPYAGPIHWGWPKRNITWQPFISDAARASEPRWIPLYMDVLEAVINKIEGA